jgi:hypothetical protein
MSTYDEDDNEDETTGLLPGSVNDEEDAEDETR